jgi:hypothetical protein
VFEKARPGYHPITVGSVEQALAEPAPEPAAAAVPAK